jgi:LCP family protein required for cell wall assembly
VANVAARLWSALRRSAALSAALSFVIPGLGQGMSGALLRGILLAGPAVILVIGAIWLMGQGMTRIFGLMLDPSVVAGLLVLDAVLLLYRSAAIVDAWMVSRRLHPRRFRSPRRQAASVGVLVVLLVATLSMHSALGVLGYKTYVADSNMFNPEGPNGGIGELPTPEPTFVATLPGQSMSTEPTPEPTPMTTPVPLAPWAADGRLNMLLVGGDAGPGRWSLRTDTMILLSVDITTGRAAFFGIPRNLINVPLGPASAKAFKCGCFPQLLNALYVYAGAHPEYFPGGNARGYLALQGAVSALTGVQVDGMLVVDLNGFVKLVNAIAPKGIRINVPYAIYDSHYPLENGAGDVPIYVKAGLQTMDGHTLLAYARSRHQDDDYHRMQRQQLVLLALRNAIKPCTLAPKLPQLIDIAGSSLWTDFSPKDMPDLLALAQQVKTSDILRYAFDPPTIPEYLDAAAVAKVHRMVANAFSALSSQLPVPNGVAEPSLPSDSGC